MDRRERVIQLLGAIGAAVIVGLLARWGIRIDPPTVPPPIVQLPPQGDSEGKPADPGPNVAAAIARIQFGAAGCTATVIGPRRDDGRWWVLTAAHCLRAVGDHGTMRFLDGRIESVVCRAINREADVAWLVTESNSDVYPYALLADSLPTAGAKIWHAGYGVDRPGSREEGEFLRGPFQDGKIEMRLSVSSGDSGGGIALDADGRVISCVCCTTKLSQKAVMYGAGVDAIRKARPTVLAADDWNPHPLPVVAPRE